MTREADTLVVILTPEGRSALASVLVTGPRATEVVGSLFFASRGRALADQPYGTILLGRWQSAESGEELVVCRRDADRIEIHCHGGYAAVRAIVDSLCTLGCVHIDWRDWVSTSEPDPIAAAARIALAHAPTERSAAILWDQYQGALRRALDKLTATFRLGDADFALARVDELLEYSAMAAHFIEPWQVVLAGRPNVGKSSLINALLGYERAIVHVSAGTTRDVVATAAAIEGWPVELVDTAGLHASTDLLESAGIRLAQARLSLADLVVLVSDASQPRTNEDAAFAATWSNVQCVHNKCDLLPASVDGSVRPEGVYCSALTRDGIDELLRTIAQRLVSKAPGPGHAVPFSIQQVDALHAIRAAIVSGELAHAERLLAMPPFGRDPAC